MPFALGQKSNANLIGVNPNLVMVVRRAIEISEQDFMVWEGVRTIERQKILVAAKKSKTMQSYHIPGNAVDLVPYDNGQPEWVWPGCYMIANAMQEAARETGIAITWGGVWDSLLNDLGDDLEHEVAIYVMHFKDSHPGKPAFTDGPHYQIEA